MDSPSFPKALLESKLILGKASSFLGKASSFLGKASSFLGKASSFLRKVSFKELVFYLVEVSFQS